MHFRELSSVRWPSVLCALGMLLGCGAAVAGQTRWVHGSWVNLRATPSTTGEVRGRLVVNSEVELLAGQDDWCEVAARSPALRGFMRCRLLGERPLALADVSREDGKGQAARAFWLAPSAARLMAAGSHFWATLLSETQRTAEEVGYRADGGPTMEFDSRNPPRILRYPVPEFEAMKDLMKKGIVAASDSRPALVRLSEVLRHGQVKPPDGRNFNGLWLDRHAWTLMFGIAATPVTESLFKRTSDLAPLGTGVEGLSAQFGIVERLRVLGGAKWVHMRHESPRVAGYWDLGSFELTLDKPVFEYLIGRQGLAAAGRWTASEKHDIAAEHGCDEGMPFLRRAPGVLPGYPTVKDPLVGIMLPEALPYKKVNIRRYAKRLVPAPSSEPPWRQYPLSLIVMHDIDLDGDAIPDLSVWEGMPAGNSAGVVAALAVLANIAGEWYLIEVGTYTECT